MSLKKVKSLISDRVDERAEELINISNTIFNQPELGYQEYKAVKILTDFLEANSFVVRKGIGGLATAFWAEYLFSSDDLGEKENLISYPKIAFLAEYDALPELGHACGHNIIGTASVGAAVALVEVLKRLKEETSTYLQVPAKIIVIGTPAEETSGGKVELIKRGYFKDINAAMMMHPGDCNVVNVSSLALEALEFIFHGKASHAAASLDKGINALDAVIEFFSKIKGLKAASPEDVKIHGIISEGGVAPNIIPERSVARFYLRARDKEMLKDIVKEVKQLAKDAAQEIGAEVSWHNYEVSYDNMVTNNSLAQIFEDNLKYLGVSDIVAERDSMGSIDMGNVSQVVPSIHPYLAIGPRGLEAHTREFASTVSSPAGHQALILGAKAMALTGFDLLTDDKWARLTK